MPIKPCVKDGKKGYQFGNGTCFTGANGKSEARRQGLAILFSEARAAGKKSGKAVDEYIAKKAGSELA